jgi:toxin ParE1/3/4
MPGCKRLADFPGIGRPCDEIRPGLRRAEHAKHVIFFGLDPEGSFVSRILHERMLPQRHTRFD